MQQLMKNRSSLSSILFLLLVLIGISVSILQPGIAHAAASPTEQIKEGVFGDKLDDDGDPPYLERTLATLVVRFSEFIIDVLGLKDYNELVFQANSGDLIFYTFDSGVFEIINGFFNSFLTISAWLCVFAILFWGFTIMFRGGTALGQSSISEMSKGMLIYFLGLYLGGYMFDLIFFGNRVIVLWAIDGLKEVTGWDVTQFSILEIMKNETTNLAHALLVLVMVIAVGILNYQYAVRLVTLIFLMVIFPLVAYTSMYPGNQKALDTWFKEFLSQVFTQAGHAIGYAIFVALLAKQPNFWILFAFLFSMPAITGLIRLIFGAPGGGTVRGSMGAGSLMAMSSLMEGVRGGGSKASASFGNKLSSLVSGGGGAGASSTTGPSANPIGAMFSKINGGGNATPPGGGGGSQTSGNPVGNFFSQGGGQFKGAGGGNPSFKDFAAANGGKMGLAKTAGSMAAGSMGRGALSVAKKGAIGAVKHAPKAMLGAAGFIAGSALTGQIGGGFVGAAIGGKAGEVAGKGAVLAGKGLHSAAKAYSDYRKDNPVQQASLKQPQLALPTGSSSPTPALPPGPPVPGVRPGGGQAQLPGKVHTPLADNGGVMVSNTPEPQYPTFPTPPNVPNGANAPIPPAGDGGRTSAKASASQATSGGKHQEPTRTGAAMQQGGSGQRRPGPSPTIPTGVPRNQNIAQTNGPQMQGGGTQQSNGNTRNSGNAFQQNNYQRNPQPTGPQANAGTGGPTPPPRSQRETQATGGNHEPSLGPTPPPYRQTGTASGPSAPRGGFSSGEQAGAQSRPKPVVIDMQPVNFNGQTIYKA